MSHITGKASVPLFGPLAQGLDPGTLLKTRKLLIDPEYDFQWVFDALEELPAYWDLLAKEIPSLGHCRGASKLRDLKGWFQTGSIPADAFPLPNILLVPSAIVMQLVEYEPYAKLENGERKHPEAYYGNADAFGLCTGLLSALAVALSTTEDELHQYGAVAIRLAMVIGATVDAEDTSEGKPEGKSRSFSVAWDSDNSWEEIDNILQRFPEVCIARKAKPLRVICLQRFSRRPTCPSSSISDV